MHYSANKYFVTAILIPVCLCVFLDYTFVKKTISSRPIHSLMWVTYCMTRKVKIQYTGRQKTSINRLIGQKQEETRGREGEAKKKVQVIKISEIWSRMERKGKRENDQEKTQDVSTGLCVTVYQDSPARHGTHRSTRQRSQWHTVSTRKRLWPGSGAGDRLNHSCQATCCTTEAGRAPHATILSSSNIW